MIRIELLGPPQRLVDEACAALPWGRPAALLAYLACQTGWVGRDEAAAVMQSDGRDSDARGYLRRLLHRLKEQRLLDGVQVEPQRLRWAAGADVREFTAAIDARRWAEALALWRGPLLEGCGALGEPAFDEWLDAERGRLRTRWRIALMARIDGLRSAGHGDEATPLLHRLLDDDALDEEAVQFALGRAAGAAQREAALAAFDRLQQRLAYEMALRPLPVTQQLSAALRQRVDEPDATRSAGAARSTNGAGQFAPANVTTDAAPRSPAPASADDAGFIGRRRELAELQALLARADVSIVTLLGPGGIGKTRLARRLAQNWDGKVLLADLSAVETQRALIDALADATGAALGDGAREPALAEWLAPRELLFVLDNFEQLTACAGRVAALAQAAPRVKWLLTSREVLGLAIEHRYELSGLAAGGGASDAAALFLRHAERHGIAPANIEAATIERIARAVAGSPLALELAAHWLPVLTAEEIAEEIEHDLGFLAAETPDRRPGHRSLRAVFDASWRLLDGVQRAALIGLTVFHGRFDRAAAADVARCDVATLLRLAGKSLVQREDAGRFRLHPLVRQFAADAAEGDEQRRLRRRHARHFLARLAGSPLPYGRFEGERVRALVEVLPEITAAWRTAVDERWFDLIAQAAANLDGLTAMTNRIELAASLAALAADALPADDPLRLPLDTLHACSLVSLHRDAEAEPLLRRLLARDPPPAQRCSLETALGRLAFVRGENDAALAWTERALASAEQAGDPYPNLRCLQNHAGALWALGRVEEAQARLRQMLLLAEDSGADLFRARAQRAIGTMRDALGHPEEALPLMQQAAAFFERVGDDYQTAYTQQVTSLVLRELGRHAEQLEQARASVAGAERSGRPAEFANSLFALALALEDNTDAAAADTYRRVLRDARRRRLVPLLLRCVYGLASLTAARSRDEALTLLAFAEAHPALRPTDRHEVQARLRRVQPAEDELATARARAATLDLDAVCARLLA